VAERSFTLPNIAITEEIATAYRRERLKVRLRSSGGIHEPLLDKRLESFALCYSQLLLLADFTPSYGFLRLEFSTVAGRG
jgi:hypothetical protein